MFKVPIDKIIPVTNARAKISSLVKNVQETKSLFVLTRGGRPAAILASVELFEKMDSQNNENNQNKNTPEKIDDDARRDTLDASNEPASKDIIDEPQTENVLENVPEEEQPVKISIK